jgi:hypothetical protein
MFLAILLLVSGNIWLGSHFLQTRYLESMLVEAERSLAERQTNLLTMASELSIVRDDLQRVQGFNTKLRLMMDMEVGVSEFAMGGSASGDLTLGYLPMHRQEQEKRKILTFLRDLADGVRLEEVQQQALLISMRDNREKLVSLPSIWPTEGFVTSGFGPRASPFTGRVQMHTGLDISARMGTPIYAPGRGTVLAAGTDGAYGNSVEINHGGGIVTKYGHMQRFVVKRGQIVERGELIGYVGRSGRVTGPHLHYEVRINGVPTNPHAYILN